MKNMFKIVGAALFAVAGLSCKKWLDQKSNQELVVPQRVAYIQALLDNNSRMNAGSSLAEASADNYYMTDNEYNALTIEGDKNIYTWKAGQFTGRPNSATDWARLYAVVYNANVAIDELPAVTDGTAAEKEKLKAAALFYRAKAFFEILLTWAPAYQAATAATDLGIPLRLNSNFNEPTKRHSMQEVMDQVIADLEWAAYVLPEQTGYRTRPGKLAVFGQLAKVYLYMAAYQKAGAYADSVLRINNQLLAYDKLNAGSSFPMPSPYADNPEVIYYSSATIGSTLAQARSSIDSMLVAMYLPGDLRKTVFFKANANNRFVFKGGYTGSETLFTGISTDELYLVKAECLARGNKTMEAMALLNQLLEKRWKTGSYTALATGDAAQALQWILQERRKQLLYRNLRFYDLKRLNVAGAQISSRRVVNSELFELKPNDNRYAVAIPEDVIAIAGIPQNPR